MWQHSQTYFERKEKKKKRGYVAIYWILCKITPKTNTITFISETPDNQLL